MSYHRMEGRNEDGSIMWQVQILRWLAKLLRIQFKIGGMPYGASYERAINRQWERQNTERGQA